jgi:hypothetical protein
MVRLHVLQLPSGGSRGEEARFPSLSKTKMNTTATSSVCRPYYNYEGCPDWYQHQMFVFNWTWTAIHAATFLLSVGYIFYAIVFAPKGFQSARPGLRLFLVLVIISSSGSEGLFPFLLSRSLTHTPSNIEPCLGGMCTQWEGCCHFSMGGPNFTIA